MKTKSFKLIIILLFFNFFLFQNLSSQNVSEVKTKYVYELADADFYKSIEKGTTIVDFWAAWCRPCRTQTPIFEETAKEMNKKVKFYKVDVDNNRGISSKLKITSIPTLIIFKNGKEVNRLIGVSSKEVIMQELKKVL